MELEPLPVTLPGSIGPLITDVQVNVAPTMLVVGKKFNGSLLQICCDKSVGLLVITGTGLTVTVTSINAPLQPFANGVILYTTVPFDIPSVEVNTWLIVFPLPADAPVTFELL